MFHNRSFTVVVALALLGVVTVIFGTAVAPPTAAPSENGVATIVKAQPKSYAELKEAQLERKDAEQFGSASSTVTGEEDSYRATQKEQRAMLKDLRVAAISPALAQSKSYDELKDAQLERSDTAQFGSTIIKAAGEEESYRATQKEQRAMQKELRAAAISPALALPSALTSGWVYHQDPLTNKWYAYHYATTPSGPVIDDTYELLGKAGGAASGCGLDRTEPDC